MFKSNKKLNPKKSAELGLKYKMQLDKAKAEFEKQEFASESEDGNVSVIVSGMREIKQLSITDEFLKNPRETIETAVISVVNSALSAVREANKQLTAEIAEKFNTQNGITVK